VQRAYAHLQASSINQARDDYEAALRQDPNNVDALLGLAVVAQRQGRSADAEAYQRRALEADPQDPHAQAAALAPNSDPQVTESRLKSLLDAQPEAAPLHFALGNLYARERRWNDAQAHYFHAVAGDTDNPDYLFNLAVSLDQLHQGRLAAQHYRLALEASERRSSTFDRPRTIRRLDQLPP
jgi:Tfp pilus assembly protein PilF